tara:strand:- start:5887 stop:7491 length:1605 start_codon:yes stop_codon:yes gene_type:complete
MKTPNINIVDLNGNPMRPSASYSGGGEGFGRQMSEWTPQLKTYDAALLPNLDLGNARADDLVRNNGIAAGGVQIHVDNIVGSSFRLSFKPRNKRLGIKPEDLAAFKSDVETLWLEEAEDDVGCWLDAERKRTFTMMVREVVSTHATFQESMAYAGWDTNASRPCRTNIKMISPKRVSNPNNALDNSLLRGGISCNAQGAALAYHVRSQDASNIYGNGYGHKWTEIARETKHGRPQFLHIFEPTEDGQTRASNHFFKVMEQLHMLPKLQHTTLQNAIVNAMYAAVIETELGPEAAADIIGGMTDSASDTKVQNYLSHIANYHETSNIRMNGVKVPHLLPQEKLHMQTSGNVDNGFVNLEESILRWTARGLNVPYEALAQNYSKTSYSSARASMLEGWRYFMGRRKIIASRFASIVFSLWLEEKLDRKHIKMPRARYGFYEAKSSWCNSEWIGSGRLAIDGLKEVKESVLRIESGLSTYEKECAQMGEDYQEIFEQQVHEMKERKAAGLPQASWVLANSFAPAEMEEPAPAQMSDR